ncbi:MAG: hypothetical protein MSG64_05335 [Pyrinomonadaceae bacterium MAG19_C2-C3]|nr:hypothetical protein [Pyrinomonadaceae bacterium MAG19_C2-C3]
MFVATPYSLKLKHSLIVMMAVVCLAFPATDVSTFAASFAENCPQESSSSPETKAKLGEAVLPNVQRRKHLQSQSAFARSHALPQRLASRTELETTPPHASLSLRVWFSTARGRRGPPASSLPRQV